MIFWCIIIELHMMFNSFFKQVLLILSFVCFLSAEFTGAQPAGHPPCWIDYYFAPGCEQCRYIENNILSQLPEIFGERIKIRKHNLYDSGEYAGARNILDQLAIPKEDNVFVVVDGEIYVGGLKNICRDLIPVVEEQLHSVRGPARGARGYAGERLKIPGHTTDNWLKGRPGAGGYFFSFSFATLLVAGLIDGLNPCAFATIVFLISMLMTGGRRENLLLIGLGFCSSVYLTYFLIGLGLFQVFRLSLVRLWLSNTVNWLLIFALIIMAFVSFRDAWIFRVTGRQNDIILKLPGWINRFIHNIIRLNLSRKHYFAGSFFLGCFVSILESVCTGQLYVPALAFLARLSEFRLQAVIYLALYNVMFILPLIAVFILAYCGVSHFAFLAWNKKNMFWTKCAMGCFFVFLAVLLYLA